MPLQKQFQNAKLPLSGIQKAIKLIIWKNIKICS
jgi:hypothetical protein